MTEKQYLILDELYFVIGFEELLNGLAISRSELQEELKKLIQLGWVKILDNDRDYEVDYEPQIFTENFNSYYYLATKKGLFEHNSH